MWSVKRENALTKILVRLKLYLWKVSQENLSPFYLVNIRISQTIDLVQFILTEKIHQFVFFVIMLLQGRSAGVHLVGTVLEPSMERGWSASVHFSGTLLEQCMEWGWSASARLAGTVLEPCMERGLNAFCPSFVVIMLLQGQSASVQLVGTVLEPCMERGWNAFVHLSFVFWLL